MKTALTADIIETASTLSVTASPDAGGQLVTVPSGAHSVTVCAPVLPIKLAYRVGTSGEFRLLDGGECVTFDAAQSGAVYLAKQSALSNPVDAGITVRTVGTVRAGDADARLVGYQVNSLTGGIVKTIWNGTQAEYDAIATPDPDTLYLIVEA
jgi:hypothetical protein